MPRRKGTHRIWYLALIGVVALALVGGLISLHAIMIGTDFQYTVIKVVAVVLALVVVVIFVQQRFRRRKWSKRS